jgi:histidinol-phosphate aminotransferase
MRPDLRPVHGGTDSAAEPRYDFSSNANPLGPCPAVLAAVRSADVTSYPDPSYTRLRETLAAHHGVAPERVVVGAGASELILRLIQCSTGAVQQLGPTFGEYARGAHVAGRRLVSMSTPTAFLRAQLRHPGIGFLCWPNNPTGDRHSLEFVEAAASAGPLVVDLAYAAMCDSALIAEIESAGARAFRLYSPNKAYGLTGVRGAYLIAPRVDRRLALRAPSWVIGRDAEAMLAASVHPQARAWLDKTIPKFVGWRLQLSRALRECGLSVRESPTTFLMAEVGNATRVARRLRQQHIRVRDASSFGLRRWIRLSAQGPAARRALLAALEQAL